MGSLRLVLLLLLVVSTTQGGRKKNKKVVEITKKQQQQKVTEVTEQEVVIDEVTEKQLQEECVDKKKWCPCMEDDCHKASIRNKCPQTCHMCESIELLSTTVETRSSEEIIQAMLLGDNEEFGITTCTGFPYRRMDCDCLAMTYSRTLSCDNVDYLPVSESAVCAKHEAHCYNPELPHDRRMKQCCKAIYCYFSKTNC
eukprot:sb/3470759/